MKAKERVFAPANCAWCDGSGRKTAAPGYLASCIVCGGKGTVTVIQPTIPCEDCAGSGRRSANALCFKCSGRGWQHAPEESTQ